MTLRTVVTKVMRQEITHGPVDTGRQGDELAWSLSCSPLIGLATGDSENSNGPRIEPCRIQYCIVLSI